MMTRRSAIAACGCCAVTMGVSASAAHGQGNASGGGRTSNPGPAQSPRASATGERADGSGLPDVHHVAFVVADRDKALASFGNAYGFGRAHKFDLKSPTARVSNGVVGFNLRAGFVWSGNTLLEFLEPVDDRSPHATWLRERGEGMHHLGYLVRSVDHELDAIATARGGVRPPLLVQGDGSEAVRWVYLESGVANGAVIELIERSPAAERFFEQIYKVTGGRMPL
ncbi:VOC family protein [Methylobacterium oryzisoli]|uniref:VOC family protein n=1 Tax=Methylobacterium oryzisoli TaxID=3385502 RepID=UPI003891F737